MVKSLCQCYSQMADELSGSYTEMRGNRGQRKSGIELKGTYSEPDDDCCHSYLNINKEQRRESSPHYDEIHSRNLAVKFHVRLYSIKDYNSINLYLLQATRGEPVTREPRGKKDDEAQDKPSSYLVLALVSLFLCICCWPAAPCAILATIYSVQVCFYLVSFNDDRYKHQSHDTKAFMLHNHTVYKQNIGYQSAFACQQAYILQLIVIGWSELSQLLNTSREVTDDDSTQYYSGTAILQTPLGPQEKPLSKTGVLISNVDLYISLHIAGTIDSVLI